MLVDTGKWRDLAPLAYEVMCLLPVAPYTAREHEILEDLNAGGACMTHEDLRGVLDSLVGLGLVVRIGAEWARAE